MNEKKLKKADAELVDWYSVIPKKFLTKSHNPNHAIHGLTVPFYGLIIGYSGAGKTRTLLDILHNMTNTFNEVFIITRNKKEPLYEYLEEKLGSDGVTITEGLNSMPDIDKFDKKEQRLLVFDDLVLEKDQRKIGEAFIRARKQNCSVLYISQSYFDVPKIIRKNLKYLFVKKLQNLGDIYRIMREYASGVSKENLIKMYQDATGDKQHFLLVDLDAPPEDRFRKNFNEIYDISDEEN
jgi:transposase-like protein